MANINNTILYTRQTKGYKCENVYSFNFRHRMHYCSATELNIGIGRGFGSIPFFTSNHIIICLTCNKYNLIKYVNNIKYLLREQFYMKFTYKTIFQVFW